MMDTRFGKECNQPEQSRPRSNGMAGFGLRPGLTKEKF
jgi:hypothetical protein